MHWLRQIRALLMRAIRLPLAQQRVDRIEHTLAELRAKVRALPPEQRAAFAREIQAMIEQQAQAQRERNDALDDRESR